MIGRVALVVAALTIAGGGIAKKAPPPVAQWAACAADKNAGEIAWAYMLRSDQTDLTGIARDGALATSLFLMGRGCLPPGTGFDNELSNAFVKAALAAWKGDLTRRSLPRPIDGWADCMVTHEPKRARAYLFARDFNTFGPKIVVQDVDPVEALFAPAPACDATRPERTDIDLLDLYARLNFRVRVEPRLQASGAATDG